MRSEIRALARLGPLPAAPNASAEGLRTYETLLHGITRPITDEEARTLVLLFGPDDCFGLAWTLLHLVESAPGWPLHECLTGTGTWTETLRGRAWRGGKLP